MAINLHSKYSDQLAKLYTKNSFVEGHTNNRWSFSGFKSIYIPSITTQPLNDYQRSGTSRYGTPKDLQDTVQEMVMMQDKSFTIVIDKGDNSEQQMMKRAAEVMKQQVAEQVVPLIDKYAINKWTEKAGKFGTMNAAPTKSTIVSSLLDAEVYLNDHFVPDSDRWAYVPNKYIKMIRLSDEFSGCDNLRNTMVVKGYVGDLSSLKIVGIPERYMPANVYFLVAQKNSVILAQKLRDGKIHQDPPGISGHLLEGRYNYDAFVVNTNSDGVYACVASSVKVVDPVITKGASKTTMTTTTSTASVYYTTDGSDPRYSPDAKKAETDGIANPVAGTVIKAVAIDPTMYNSDVVTHICV